LLALCVVGVLATNIVGAIVGPPRLDRIKDANDPMFVAIGMSEGNRIKGGGFTTSYHGHRDPGDRKWNKGTISAAPRGNGVTADMSAEQVDEFYIAKLNAQIEILEKKGWKGDRLTLVNYLDLVVQAPVVAQYFAQHYKPGADIVKTRVDGFRRTDGSIDASGFGHSEAQLQADQERRFDRLKEGLS
jgi:hypothetical protein